MTVLERTIEFLKKKNDWVEQKYLVATMLTSGVLRKDIDDTIKRIRHIIFIGHVYENGENKYRWYDMPEQEQKERLEQIAYFDSLP